MTTLDAKPENLEDILQRLLPEDELNLVAGEYKGQFVINQPITLRGVGKETRIFNIDTPPLIINCAGVKIENLSLARSDGGELIIGENTPLLHQVSLRGIIRDSQYKHHHWLLPTSINFGDIPPDSIIEQNCELEIGLPCTVEHNISWLSIKENGFYPGKFNLSLQVNSADMVAGTILSKDLIFSAIDGQKYPLSLGGKIVAIESNRDKVINNLSIDSSKTKAITSQNWGFTLSGKVIDNLIRYFGDSSDYQYLSYAEKRSLAEGIINNIFGQNYHTFYIHRQKKGENYREEIWDLTLATDRESDNIPPVLMQKNKTIVFRGVLENGNDRALKLISVNLLIPEKGRRDDFSLPVSIKLLPNYQYRCHIPEIAIASIQQLPFCENFIPTEEQLEAWKIFVDIEERMARERQFCVAFSGHNYGVATRNITFDVKINSATIDGDKKDSLSVDGLWYRLRRAMNDSIKICLTPPYLNDDDSGRLLGDIIAIEPKNNTVKIRLALEFIDSLEKGYYQLPSNGFLYYEAAGDIIQVKRKRNALKDLKQGKTQNRLLSQFFFDSSQARSSDDTIKLSPSELLLSTANPNQIKAVEKVLVCPDLTLIQGPPGTGKTTVIAEICYQIAKRGGKTLIASQGNLAVDNALSRLIHNPLIRALRKGNASRVEEEGLPFLEDRVIDKWLTDTANSCEERLNTKKNNVKIFQELLTYADDFNRYISLERNYNYQKESLEIRKENIINYCKKQTTDITQYEQEIKLIQPIILDLEKLTNSPDSLDFNNPVILLFLKKISIYLADNRQYHNFYNLVKNGFLKAKQLGYNFDDSEVLIQGVWLNQYVKISIEKYKKNINILDDLWEKVDVFSNQLELLENLEEEKFNLKQKNNEFEQKRQELESKLIEAQDFESKIKNAQNDLNYWKENIANDFIQNILDQFYVQMEVTPSTFASIFSKIVENKSLTKREQNDYKNQLKLLSIGNNFNNILSIRWNIISIETTYQEIEQILDSQPLKIQTKLKDFDSNIGYKVVEKFKKFLQEYDISFSYLEKDIDYSDNFITRKHLNNLRLELINLKRKIKEVIVKINSQGGLFSNAIGFLTQSDPFEIQIYELYRLKRSSDKLRQTFLSIKNNLFLQSQEETVEATKEKVIDVISNDLREHYSLLNEITLQKINSTKKAIQDVVDLTKINSTDLEKINDNITIQTNKIEKCFLNILEEIKGINIDNLPDFVAKNIREYLPINITYSQLKKAISLKDVLNKYTNDFEELDIIIKQINISSIFLDLLSSLQSNIRNTKNLLKSQQENLTNAQKNLEEITEKLNNLETNINTQRQWWLLTWQSIPVKFKPQARENELFNLEFLETIQQQFNLWQEELQKEEHYLDRYGKLIEDWVNKLENPTPQDAHELKRIYLDNANVIGITCNQASSRRFREEFNDFDVVIIDEVSKCTPPELLMAALKAKKLVLIGDYRQLPPMLNEDSIEEIAEEMGLIANDLNFFSESLFKIQYESASDNIKQMLTTQYRMHPIIMGAINQFYDNFLECGINNPDQVRNHQFNHELITPNHHLMWIKTPCQQEFFETKLGTSFVNEMEINVIKNICEIMENQWKEKISQGYGKKQVGIITFYLSQMKLIEEKLDINAFPSLEIRCGTVDRFQGMERQVIIVSLVRNNPRREIGFAKKPERINVAFSRAQELLIIVGCHQLFTENTSNATKIYQQVANIVKNNGGLIDVSRFI